MYTYICTGILSIHLSPILEGGYTGVAAFFEIFPGLSSEDALLEKRYIYIYAKEKNIY